MTNEIQGPALGKFGRIKQRFPGPRLGCLSELVELLALTALMASFFFAFIFAIWG